MDRSERFYKIEQMLHDRRVVPLSAFLEALEVSRATFKRDLEYLRDRFSAPVVWDREAGGYRFDAPAKHAPRHELPGLWFNPSEIHALLTMQHLLSGLEPGLLAPHVAPLQARLRALLAADDQSPEEIEKRIRIIRLAARPMKLQFFELAATATLKRQRLAITYWARSSDETTRREISPQRLVFYRANWYLDAWCHLRDALRSFSLDGIRKAIGVTGKAKNVPAAELDAFLASGYGIFSGRDTRWATLRFSPKASRWVASEEWHPKQRQRTEPDGSTILELPYSEDTELVMDILRHGAEVEVLGPANLRARVKQSLAATLKRYE